MFGCGQCLPCRFNKRRVWTHRIMLESNNHADNAFVTLTYADETLPPDGSLSPKHLQDFLKRFRKLVEPQRIRFFAVGEYGDATQRPHYHLALFGWPRCLNIQTRYRSDGFNCCSVCEAVHRSWGFGRVDVGGLETNSAQYIAGYVTKKMTKRDDPRLHGREPEFARMSLRPGIGAFFMDEVASTFLTFNLEQTEGDVPSSLRHGSRQLPLGRYLRRQLRRKIGKDEKAPQVTLDQAKAEMHDLWQAALDATSAPGMRRFIRPVFQDMVAARTKPLAASAEAKAKIYKQKRDL